MKGPKRKEGTSMEADIEMIERCIDENDEVSDSDDTNLGEDDKSDLNTEQSESAKPPLIKTSKETKSGLAKSVSWSESEENTPRFSKRSPAEAPRNLGARPKTARQLKPLIRQKESLEGADAIIDEIRESGEEASIFKQETSTSEMVTKTTSVVKRSSTLMEKIRQRSSQSRTRSEVSDDETDSSDSDKDEVQDKTDDEYSSGGEVGRDHQKILDYDEQNEIEQEENKETVGPLKKLSSGRKKSSSSSIGGEKRVMKRPALQKQGSRYDIRLREEDSSAQTAFEKRQESRKEKAKSHWSELRDSVHSGSVHSLVAPTKEESYDFFTKVWESTSVGNITSHQQKRSVIEEGRNKKKQKRGNSRDDPASYSDDDRDEDYSDADER